MATQVIVLGTWDFGVASQILWFVTNVEGALPSGFVAEDSPDVYVSQARIFSSGQFQVTLMGGSEAFSADFLVQADAFVISAPGIASVTFDAPNHPNNGLMDEGEPYNWNPR